MGIYGCCFLLIAVYDSNIYIIIMYDTENETKQFAIT